MWLISQSGWANVLLGITIGVGVIGVVVTIAISFSGGGAWDQVGKGGFALDVSEAPRGPRPGSPAAKAEADEEIRQLVEAKSARREARGLAPLDIEAEIRSLKRAATPGLGDPALREEVRGLVEARNERRARQGKAPLDVEAEIAAKIAELDA